MCATALNWAVFSIRFDVPQFKAVPRCGLYSQWMGISWRGLRPQPKDVISGNDLMS